MTTAERQADRAVQAVANAVVGEFVAQTDTEYVRAMRCLDEAAQAATDEQYKEGERRALRRIEAIQDEER
jgi:hypothetical protein